MKFVKATLLIYSFIVMLGLTLTGSLFFLHGCSKWNWLGSIADTLRKIPAEHFWIFIVVITGACLFTLVYLTFTFLNSLKKQV